MKPRNNRPVFLIAALLLGLAVAGCQPIEMSVRDGIAGAKGYISKALDQYPQCNQPNTDADQNCSIIHKTAAAQHLAGAALETYCAGPDFETGGACNPPTDKDRKGQLAAKLKEAGNQLGREISAIKTLRGVQ